MNTPTADLSADLSCHRCGYDLRAHAREAKCPECGELVTESLRLAAIPRGPKWRDSDPRWRRRMLAGVWTLALLPVVDAFLTSDWASGVTVPTVFDYQGPLTLGDTFLCWMLVHQPFLFCIGVVLLFSKERGRRRGRLDWTRRWGVLCSYVTFLLSILPMLFIWALVLAGIAFIFLSMPLKYQPGVTKLFVNLSSTYLRYVAPPKHITDSVLAFSSIAILFACVPLFNALCSSGPKRVARILLIPLALFALVHIAQAGRHFVNYSSADQREFFDYQWYFRPAVLRSATVDLPDVLNAPGLFSTSILVDIAKWYIVLAIAIWLSIAQIMAPWQRRKPSAASPAASPG